MITRCPTTPANFWPRPNYSASDLQMLAVICACDWRCYREGAKFTIVTNHQPNTYLDVSSTTLTLNRRARWLDMLCGYDYTWCYRPRRLNVADPLSRAPLHAVQHQPSVALAPQLIRHAASATRIPSSSSGALCALKSYRLTRQSVAQDAGQPSLTRGASGLHKSDGGGDRPSSNSYNEIAAEQQADASYPAGSADDGIAASSFALQHFVQRFKRGNTIGPCRHLSLTTLRCGRIRTDYAGQLRTDWLSRRSTD